MANFTAVSAEARAPFETKGDSKHAMVPLITFIGDLPAEEIPCFRWIHVDLYKREHKLEIHWALSSHGQTRDAFAHLAFGFNLEGDGIELFSSLEALPKTLKISRSHLSWHNDQIILKDNNNKTFNKADHLIIPPLTLTVPWSDVKMRRFRMQRPTNIAEAEEALKNAEDNRYPDSASEIANRLVGLATFLKQANRSDEAEALLMKAIEVWENTYPADNMPYRTLEKLADLLKRNRKGEIGQLYSRVVKVSETYQLRKRVFLEPRNYPPFTYEEAMFKFKTDKKLFEYMVDIAKTMVCLFDIAPEEAVGRINDQWRGTTFSLNPEYDLVYHRVPDYWARMIYYVDNTHWWTRPPQPLKAKPYPETHSSQPQFNLLDNTYAET